MPDGQTDTFEVSIPGLDHAPTRHVRLISWVRETALLTRPDRVVLVRWLASGNGMN